MYEKECIFCGKKDKYKKGIKEGLTQARELSVNYSVRKAVIIKQDSRILAILSRDLVAAEGHYYRTCYRHQQRNLTKAKNLKNTMTVTV